MIRTLVIGKAMPEKVRRAENQHQHQHPAHGRRRHQHCAGTTPAAAYVVIATASEILTDPHFWERGTLRPMRNAAIAISEDHQYPASEIAVITELREAIRYELNR